MQKICPHGQSINGVGMATTLDQYNFFILDQKKNHLPSPVPMRASTELIREYLQHNLISSLCFQSFH